MTTTYKPIDSKREEFRKYLERAGVMDALTKCLVSLYEETDKPTDALEYVRKHLGDDRPDVAEFQKVKNDLEQALAQIAELQEENLRLNKLLSDQQQEQPQQEETELATGVEGEPAALGEATVVEEQQSTTENPGA